MDPLSHGLLGAVCGLAAARRGARGALLAGAVGALLPDADVLLRSNVDPLLTLELHRTFSHSLLAAPVGAALAATAVWLLRRRQPGWRTLYVAALAGFLSAILLDACTSYGTQLGWPFSATRYAASVIAVVDPLMTGLLLIGAVAAWRRRSAVPAWAALACALAYLGLGGVQHARAVAAVSALAATRGDTLKRLVVKPTLGNLLLWRAVYEADGVFWIGAIRVPPLGEPVVYPGQPQPRLDLASVEASATQRRDLARFATVSDGWLVRHPDHADVVGDIRYAMLPDAHRPLWGVQLQREAPSRHVSLETFRSFSAEDRAHFLAMLKGHPVAAHAD
jgi:inner membrane protein